MTTDHVRRFFEDPAMHSGIWLKYLNEYVSIPNKIQDAEKFGAVDRYYHALDVSRGFITKNELVEIMRWKLMRGKMRPLMGKIEALNDTDVQIATTNGINAIRQSIDDEHVKMALDAIAKPLKGVGPATASAILAKWNTMIPFMSDAGLIATGTKLNYTVTDYLRYYHAIIAKVAELKADGQTPGYSWTAKEIEAVLHIIYSRHDLRIPF